MSGKEIIRASPTIITHTKSYEGVSVKLTLELPEPKDMEIALALVDEIKKNLTYPHPNFNAASEQAAAFNHFCLPDLPQSVRHKLAERAVEENCSIHTLCVHWIMRLCERGF